MLHIFFLYLAVLSVCYLSYAVISLALIIRIGDIIPEEWTVLDRIKSIIKCDGQDDHFWSLNVRHGLKIIQRVDISKMLDILVRYDYIERTEKEGILHYRKKGSKNKRIPIPFSETALAK